MLALACMAQCNGVVVAMQTSSGQLLQDHVNCTDPGSSCFVFVLLPSVQQCANAFLNLQQHSRTFLMNPLLPDASRHRSILNACADRPLHLRS